MDHGPRASIHFPIEGVSPWLYILRVIALGSTGALAVVAAMMVTMHGSGGDLAVILGGLSVFLVIEYFVVRAIVVPRIADYGRFRVYERKVDYFPLTFTGLTVSTASDSEPIDNFSGLSVHADPQKGQYRVLLNHKERGRTICLKTYHAPEPANSHAEALAQSLHLGYAPFKGGRRTA